jgi:hypothetical protein
MVKVMMDLALSLIVVTFTFIMHRAILHYSGTGIYISSSS